MCSKIIPNTTPNVCKMSNEIMAVCLMFWSCYCLFVVRMVNSALEEEMKSIHALTQKTLTPEQWQQQQLAAT